MTAAELKKLWTMQTLTDGATGEKLIDLSNYKGSSGKVVVPAFVGKTPVRRFSCVMPAHVTKVEFETDAIEIKGSFRNCTTLADKDGFIVLPIGARAILTDYIGPKDIETLSIPEGVTENTYGTFWKLKIRKVSFPKSFEKLAGGSFDDCERLQSVELPDGLKEIGQLAFSGCRALKEIYIPSSVEKIEFFDFNKIAEIYGEPGSAAQRYAEEHTIPFHAGRVPERELSPFVISDGTLEQYVGSDLNVEIPKGVKAIAGHAFSENEKIKNIIAPDGLKEIESFAFRLCRNLVSVSFPQSLRKIDRYAFSDCYALKKLLLPDGVTEVEENAFAFCYALEVIIVPASVEQIGKDAFSYCSKLTIHAPAGSFAEQYAKKNNIPFVAE